MLNMNFWITNLLMPGDPANVPIATPQGSWQFVKMAEFARNSAAIRGAAAPRPTMPPVAETYYLRDTAGADDVARFDAEVTPILLAATYATGMSVTSQRATKNGVDAIVQQSEHWPRPRGLDQPSPVVSTLDEFVRLVEAFVRSWPAAGQAEKALLLVHHWLDSLSCWSMEDLYLSATTQLQVIVATEATRQGKKELPFYDGLSDAAGSMGIPALSTDFKNMRNELVHDGRLIGKRFAGPDKARARPLWPTCSTGSTRICTRR
ncbi:hypothetical protein [Burkholderia multivorans]|uniref:hypothetical protein n=1 Tax=Burkholderia multivorans TaxID=87883 RepID=UPI000CFF3AED|nr:hypothetical protein [Burkholderia multivorans]PRG18066.1 hypothetical protein C6Q35_27640 [Burkholderia multivorans]